MADDAHRLRQFSARQLLALPAPGKRAADFEDAPPAKVGPTGQITQPFTPSFTPSLAITPSFANANAGAKAAFANPPAQKQAGQFLSTFAAPANPTGALGFARNGPAYAAAMANLPQQGNGMFKM